MIIIAFSKKTSKIMPRIFCRKFKHVAPILIKNDGLEIWQFVNRKSIVKILLKWRDLKILGEYGWEFIVQDCVTNDVKTGRMLTCVQLTKKVLGIKNRRIQTPYALYKFLWGLIRGNDERERVCPCGAMDSRLESPTKFD